MLDISDSDRRKRMKIGSVLAIIFAVASAFFLKTIYFQVADSVRSTTWPSVSGVVLESEVDITVRTQEGSSYWPTVRYRYSVAGQQYESSKLYFIQDGVGEDWARDKVESYPPDAVVDVYYHPSKPGSAVLEPGSQLRWLLFTVGAAALFCIVFAGLAWLCFADVRKMQRFGPQ